MTVLVLTSDAVVLALMEPVTAMNFMFLPYLSADWGSPIFLECISVKKPWFCILHGLLNIPAHARPQEMLVKVVVVEKGSCRMHDTVEIMGFEGLIS